MNTAEGVRRLATVVRWIGDGLGILCIVGGVSILISNNDDMWGLWIGLIGGAFSSGCGRAISWVLQGFAKSD